MSRISLVILLFLSGFSCTNKSVEDYRKDLVERELAKIKSISGIYNGDYQFATDQQNTNPISFEIKPNVKSKESSDGLKSELRAVFEGKLAYHGNPPATLYFSEGTYNERDGTISATALVRDPTDSIATNKHIELYGTIMSGKLSARLRAQEYPETEAKMELSLGSKVIGSRENTEHLKSIVYVYAGRFENKKDLKTYDVVMTIRIPVINAELFFYNQFLPNISAAINLNFKSFQLNTYKGHYGKQSVFATFTDNTTGLSNELLCTKPTSAESNQLNCSLSNAKTGAISEGTLSRVQQ